MPARLLNPRQPTAVRRYTDETDREARNVLGASMAGLAAARVLATPTNRSRCWSATRSLGLPPTARVFPQSHHAHGLLAAGRVALEE